MIIAIFSAIGSTLKNNLKYKSQIYCQLCDFNDKLILNLKYERKSIPQILKHFKELNDLIINEEYDKKDDVILVDYFNCIGKTDSASQIDYLSTIGQELKREKELRLEKYNRYGPLYLKIFVMIGVLIAVLMA